MISRNDPCWCNSKKKWKRCHYPLRPPPDFSTLRQDYFKKYRIPLKTPQEIQGIRRSCQLAAKILQNICAQAREGVTTRELDELALELHKREGAIPAPLNYGTPPFPGAICTSLNEVICHGIPDMRPLQEGDILNIDVTTILDGYYGDCSAMVSIGEISEEKRRVTEASYEAMMRAIAILKPGVPIMKIGETIEGYARTIPVSVVNQFTGHGTGVGFHEPPQIPHHYNQMQLPLVEGMTFTIEPMVNAGVREAVIDPENRWTARTADGKPSAQWEHTLLITTEGYEILTLPPAK